MSSININNLTFAYEGSPDNIFENVSFQLDTNWKLGLIGRNGKGKTTFLRLLMGELEYSGTIMHQAVFEYFPFPVRDETLLTQQIAEEIHPFIENWQFLRELNLLEVKEDVLARPFHTLSKGEQTKVLLAVLFLKEDHFLLIDEPTNHLDLEARETVSAYLNSKKGFILVSHDRQFMDRAVDHVLAINRSDIQLQRGNFSSWEKNKAYQDQFELNRNAKLKKDITRLKNAAKQRGDWADKVEATKIGSGSEERREYIAEKSRKMQKRRKDMEGKRERAIEEKEGLLKNLERVDSLKLSPLKYHTQRLVEAENVYLFYGKKQVVKDVSFALESGERVLFQGRNGTGKSSILKLIIGEEIHCQGVFRRGSGLKISYVSQDTGWLAGDLKTFSAQWNLDESLFKAILRKLDFKREQFDKDMRDFSQGQKKKVLLAKSLSEQAHIYVWDEPLNYIDVFSRIQIENLILEYRPTMILVEHDKVFADRIATKVIQL